jgi:pilus assembly protein CpaC
MVRGVKAFLLIIAIVGSSIVYAADTENVHLMVGRSTVIHTGSPIARVSLTSADVADALVTSASELLINGKMPGTISMMVWDRAGAIRKYEIVVQRDITRLTEQLRQLFPGETITAQSNGKTIVLAGKVNGKDVIEKAVSLAAGYVDKKDEVVSLLQIAETAPSSQVLLRVRFAEVSRNALTELGASFALNGFKDGRWFGRTTTQQFPAPQWDEDGKFIFSDFLNLFLFDSSEQIAGTIRALKSRGLFQSLAEPNLVSESGKEASFLAGGEIPIPIAQPSAGGGVTVTVQYKEFGIRLNFTPTINGDRVHLKVRPEVSTLDFVNAVTLQGFRIPALTTRRTETELELQNGQTFAIAGLMNNQLNKSLQKIPGIGDIPILGLLFRSQAAQKDRTELVVMITPQILPRNSRGVTTDLPRLQEPYLEPLPPNKSFEPPAPAFVPTRGMAQNQSGRPAKGSATSGNEKDPASAAEAMKALQPNNRPIVTADPKSADGAAAPTNRPLTREEQQMLDRIQKMEAKSGGKGLDAQRKRGESELAKREAKDAKRRAEIDRVAHENAAKRNAQIAKKQAEQDKKKQKQIAEAEAKLKAAQAAYEAELAKTKKQ